MSPIGSPPLRPAKAMWSPSERAVMSVGPSAIAISASLSAPEALAICPAYGFTSEPMSW